MTLTLEEKVCNNETYEHIHKLQHYLNVMIKELIDRGNVHDRSKLEQPEVTLLAEQTSKLTDQTFGSKEYIGMIEGALAPALAHHYARNRHHPQHFPNGVTGMNLLDLVEMICDWKASSLRHKDGNLLKSVDFNGKRFGMSDQLIEIFRNTAELIDNV